MRSVHRRSRARFVISLVASTFLWSCSGVQESILDDRATTKQTLSPNKNSKSNRDNQPIENWLAGVRKQIESDEYKASLQVKGADGSKFDNPKWHFANRKQNFRSYVDEDGWELRPREAIEGQRDWTWRYSFQSLKRSKDEILLGKERSVTANDHEILINHSSPPGVKEWYKNTQAGIEQGFEITKRPLVNGENGQHELVLSGLVKTDLRLNVATKEKLIFTTTERNAIHYAGLKVFDSKGKVLRSYLSSKPDENRKGTYSVDIHIDDSDAAYPILIDPLATSASWTAQNNQSQARLGYAVSTAGDVNGDGYSDLIVGAPQYDNGAGFEGRVYVYHGGSSGLEVSPSWTKTGDQASGYLGTAVAYAGDVNADGYSDVIVSSFLASL